MNYSDILEKLGIIVNDEDRTYKFRVSIFNIIPIYDNVRIGYETVFSVCQRIGIPINTVVNDIRFPVDSSDFLQNILFPEDYNRRRSPVEFNEFLARISILIQEDFFIENDFLKNWVERALNEWKLPYELCDGIIIPKGVKEFDEALVCDVADWLKKYPSVHKVYITVLQQYFNGDEPRDIADNLRKTLEAFLQGFFNNEKNLVNNISEIGTYLEKQSVPKEVRNMYTALIDYYNKHNDKTAKHHDKTDINSVEFLLYQTGIFMRFLLVLRRNSTDVNA